MGVATGCGCKEVQNIDFLILLILTLLVSVLFCSSILLFVHFLFQYFFVIKFYALNNFFVQYKHTYG